MNWKIWKRNQTYEESCDCCETLTEEDGNAAMQNADEIHFNKDNPILFKRSMVAKRELIKRLSKDDKYKILEQVHLNESLSDEFIYGDPHDDK